MQPCSNGVWPFSQGFGRFQNLVRKLHKIAFCPNHMHPQQEGLVWPAAALQRASRLGMPGQQQEEEDDTG